MRGRTVLYVLLALAVPTGAFALTEGGATTAEAPSLSVAASLDTCGTAADSIVCKIDASWNDVPGADRYTASVARADGSVVDYGDVGAGSTSFWVPYVGNGTYTVTVSAYGTAPVSGKPKVLAKASSDASGDGDKASATSLGTVGQQADVVSDPPETTTGGAGDPDPTCDEASDDQKPDPDEPPAEDSSIDQPSPDVPAQETTSGAGDLSEQTAEALDDEAELPDSVACPVE